MSSVGNSEAKNFSKVNNNETFHFITILRGLASLLVMWAHLSGFWLFSMGLNSGLQNIWSNWIAFPFRLTYNGGDFAVILFFLISGFIITFVSFRESRKVFAIKRVMRIFPPLFVAITVAWILFRLSEHLGVSLFGVHGGGLLHWISSLFLLDGYISSERAINVTWTLVVEVSFYTLTFLVISLTKRNPLKSQWFMTLAWVFICLCAINITFINNTINSGTYLFVGFLLFGRAVYLFYSNRIGIKDLILNGFFLLYIITAFTGYPRPGFLITPRYEAVPEYLLAVGIFLGMLNMSIKRVPKVFQFLADISYSLYLLHMPIGIFTMNYLHSIGIAPSASTLIAMTISIFAAYISYKTIEAYSHKTTKAWIKKIN